VLWTASEISQLVKLGEKGVKFWHAKHLARRNGELPCRVAGYKRIRKAGERADCYKYFLL